MQKLWRFKWKPNSSGLVTNAKASTNVTETKTKILESKKTEIVFNTRIIEIEIKYLILLVLLSRLSLIS